MQSFCLQNEGFDNRVNIKMKSIVYEVPFGFGKKIRAESQRLLQESLDRANNNTRFKPVAKQNNAKQDKFFVSFVMLSSRANQTVKQKYKKFCFAWHCTRGCTRAMRDM